ncbi:MAG: hypothetical protein ACTHJT_15320 [Cytophaga sp.]|uniref:hypothetical protein n=1 Tax=Cytophaga sp. TaxID=29535 RepID=UPI003F807A81
MKRILLYSICLILIAPACTSPETDGTQVLDSAMFNKTDSLPSVNPDTLPKQSANTSLQFNAEDKANLLLFEKVSLGMSSGQVQNKFTYFSQLHAEDLNDQLGAKGFQESIMDIHFLNRKGKLEFNFKSDTLYRYSIVFNESNEAKGNKIYAQILNYYNDYIGSAQPVNIEEDNHYAQLTTWFLNPDYLIVSYNLNTGNITITAQNTKPGQ